MFFFSELIFFSRSLFNFEAFEGRVFFLGLGFFKASVIIVINRWNADSLLECWLLEALLSRIRIPSVVRREESFLSRRDLSSSVKAVEEGISKCTTTLDAVLFTCCPPGPELLTAFQVASEIKRSV